MQAYPTIPSPDTPDVWARLAADPSPVVVYGMGNGADKLFSRLERYGIRVSGVCASDGFVRGQSFRGFPVISVSDAARQFPGCRFLLAFATSRPEVLASLDALRARVPLWMPDLPVAGDRWFDRAYYAAHYADFRRVCGMFCDDLSRDLYRAILTYKLTGDPAILRDAWTLPEDKFGLLDVPHIRSYVDCGAYNGDTLRELLALGAPVTHALCVEPDPRTFRRLLRYTDTLPAGMVTAVSAAVWDGMADGVLMGADNRNSSLMSASYQHRAEPVRLTTVDALAQGISPDYIKYDVEGAERQALIGSRETIARARPRLSVSVYHRTEDLIDLIDLTAGLTEGYRLYLRRRECLPAWEIDLIAVPDECPAGH